MLTIVKMKKSRYTPGWNLFQWPPKFILLHFPIASIIRSIADKRYSGARKCNGIRGVSDKHVYGPETIYYNIRGLVREYELPSRYSSSEEFFPVKIYMRDSTLTRTLFSLYFSLYVCYIFCYLSIWPRQYSIHLFIFDKIPIDV